MSRLDRWERRTNLPLLALALVFLAAFLLPLYEPDLPLGVRPLLRATNVLVWLAFATDYVVRLCLSTDRRLFVRRHVPDLLTLAVPVLRPLRLLRVFGVLGSASRRAGQTSIAGTTAFIVGAVSLVLVVGAGLVLDAERAAEGANIKNAPDALWWAASTVTTVGYGDRFPVTGEGRMVAVGVMLAGIVLLGVITASIAAWFVQRVQAQDAADADLTLHDVMRELQDLRALLEGQQPPAQDRLL